jgi:uncharacterized protein YjbJ (UPF0337 family)
MNSRAGRQRFRRFGSVAFVAIAVLLAPQIASAIDDPAGTISDPVNAVTGTATDATGQVTGTATDATGQVTGTATDATGQVTGTATDATGQVTGTATDATGQVTGAVENTTGSVTGNPAHLGSGATTSLTSSQKAGSASTDPTEQGSAASGSISRSDSPASGVPRWAALHMSEAEYMPGGGIDTRSEDEGLTGSDPCEADQRLVCLGVLFGLGEFGDVGAKVIASLAQTGVATLGLAALTLLLAIAGSLVLAASSRRVASVARID